MSFLKMNAAGGVEAGGVSVATTNNAGLPVEYWADRCVERIVHVAGDSDSIIKQQAVVFREAVRDTVNQYMKQAIKSDRTTLYNLFVQQGHRDMAEILRRL